MLRASVFLFWYVKLLFNVSSSAVYRSFAFSVTAYTLLSSDSTCTDAVFTNDVTGSSKRQTRNKVTVVGPVPILIRCSTTRQPGADVITGDSYLSLQAEIVISVSRKQQYFIVVFKYALLW